MGAKAALMLCCALALPLSGCGGSNGALLASGGVADFQAIGWISDAYGTGEPLATIPVMVADQEYTFRIWISKDGRRVMAQTASLGTTATAGFLRGLTAGAVSGDLDYEGYKQAAQQYLDNARGPGCVLQLNRKITHIGFEWDFACETARPKPPTTAKPKNRLR